MTKKILTEKSVAEFQNKILSWYKINKRDFPWRKTADPYCILVSEIMLQQTQAMRVIPFYMQFIKKFPSSYKLAEAKNIDIFKVWSGLGFNNRAIRLKEIAKIIVNDYAGIFPKKPEQLLVLNGIGTYTAGAIMAFAYNKKYPVIDTNIRRVLIHEFNLSEDISLKRLSELALLLIPNGKSRIWHNALMDYGALAATAKQTKIKTKSKQSKFKGSEREVRGKILRLLLEKKKCSLAMLKETFAHHNFDEIIVKMKADGLIRESKGSIEIKK